MPSVSDRFPESGHFSAKTWNQSGDLNLQIAYVAYDETIGWDKTADVVHFANDGRTLPLNQTTATIARIHGEEMDDWRAMPAMTLGSARPRPNSTVTMISATPKEIRLPNGW